MGKLGGFVRWGPWSWLPFIPSVRNCPSWGLGHPYASAIGNKAEKLRDSGWDLVGKSLQNSDRNICWWSGWLKSKGLESPVVNQTTGPAGEESVPQGALSMQPCPAVAVKKCRPRAARSSDVLRDAIKDPDFQMLGNWFNALYNTVYRLKKTNLSAGSGLQGSRLLNSGWGLTFISPFRGFRGGDSRGVSGGWVESPHVSTFALLPRSSHC